MNSKQLAERMGEGWNAAGFYPAHASRGACSVRATGAGWFAEFRSVGISTNATAKTPEGAVRSCLLGAYRQVRVVLDDIEAVEPGLIGEVSK